MFELTISGRDPQELYVNAVNLSVLLARGGVSLFTKPEAQTVTAVETGGQVQTAEPVGDVTKIDPPIGKPTRKPRTPKETNELSPAVEPPAKSDPLDIGDIPPGLDRRGELNKPAVEEDPLGLADAAPPAADKKPLTLDDMRDRVKAIIAAHTERGNKMPECIAYVRKLFEPFGIKLAAELKPDKFDEFWSKSQAYLDGGTK